MKMGIHAATSGATDGFKRVAEALQASVFSWVSLNTDGPHKPHDALAFPNGTHILRLANPARYEPVQQWMGRVIPVLDAWASVGIPPGALIVQHANEPDQGGAVDLESAWDLGVWSFKAHEYRDALKARYPNLPLLAPPFTCANTKYLSADYLAGYEGAAIHCYWSAGNPGWRQGRDGGAAWRVATDLGVPVYVTEVNSNPANAAEIAAWERDVDSPLVLGATIFIADSAQSWPQYNVTPELATEILSLRHPAPVEPPSPPPPEDTVGYTRESDPRGHKSLAFAWKDALDARNPAEASDIWNAYQICAATINYDANLAIAQGWVETAGFTSSRWRNAHNAAGIGIYADETPDVDFRNVESGVQAQLALLNCYFGNGFDNWGVLSAHGFGGFTKHFSRLSQMDGVWAEDTGYSAAIIAVANEVMGGTIPAPAPQPSPSHRYRFVEPVDCPVIQGSMGSYSHAGSRPGSVFYAIDSGCAFGTPIRCIADGDVIYNGFNHGLEGQTGHTICVRHADGYESRYCHLSEYDTPLGAAVTQGRIIAHTGAPDYPYPGANGYGEGAHLHWSVSLDGRWIKVEDLEAAGEMGPWGGAQPQEEEKDVLVQGHLDDGMIERLWYGNAGKAARKKIAYNPQSGIGQRWKKELLDGHPLGVAQSGEETDADRVVQFFASGAITFIKTTGETFVN